MKRLLISLSLCIFLANVSFAQDKNVNNDDMYGGKNRNNNNKKTRLDNYDSDKYESSKTRKSDTNNEKNEEVYDYSPESVEKHKNPTWMSWETNTARSVDTSLINQYYRKRSTATMINLYKVDSSSIVWHDYKAERKQARRNYRLQKMAIRRSGGYYNNAYYPGYGYGYGGMRPRVGLGLGLGWNSRNGWSINPSIGFGYGGYYSPYSGYGYGSGYGGYYPNYGYNNYNYGYGNHHHHNYGNYSHNGNGYNPAPTPHLRYR